MEEENGCQRSEQYLDFNERSEQYLGFNVIPHQPLNEVKKLFFFFNAKSPEK